MENETFTSELHSKLLSQADVVSSENTNLESKIGEAISSTRKAGEASTKAFESKADREIGFQREQFGQQRETALESGRGFAVSNIALKQLDERTEKSLRDLEQRKQELILQGEAQTASKIADLQFQAIEFRQQAEQQTFQNLLSTASFGLEQKQEQRLERSQTFAEKQAIANLATEFGVEVKSGDTIATITARVAPLASDERKLALEERRARITQINADTQRLLRGEDVTLDADTIDSIARAANSNPSVLGLIQDTDQAAQVINRMEVLNRPRDFTRDELVPEITQLKNSGISFNEAVGTIVSDARITNKDEAREIAKEIFNIQERDRGPRGGLLGDIATRFNITGGLLGELNKNK